MFGIQFYPTPKPIVLQMLEPFLEKDQHNELRLKRVKGIPIIKTVLDPSAGKGDILDVCKKLSQHREYEPNLYGIEIDSNLSSIIKEKKYTIIGEDFLKFNNQLNRRFNLIIMNPPFNTGDSHLLHAWDILIEGDIVCLLNAETIRNLSTPKRKLIAEIIKENGSVEYIGSVFKDAERETNVEVALIRLSKKAEHDVFDFDFSNLGTIEGTDLTGDDFKNAIASRDVIENMVFRFKVLQETYVELSKGFAKLVFAEQDLIPHNWNLPNDFKYIPCNYEEFCSHYNKGMWKHLINKLDCQMLLTNNVRQSFNKYIDDLGYLEFNKNNVGEFLTMLYQNQDTIMDTAILEVFDIFTAYHKENRCYTEGWKTNDSWKVNQKIILPRWLQYGKYMTTHSLKEYGDRFTLSDHYRNNYEDIDKVMAFISGKDYSKIETLSNTLRDLFIKLGHVKTGDDINNSGESEFFRFKFFRKGTLHIEFKSKELWTEFNMRVWAHKKWLNPVEEQQWHKSKTSAHTSNPKKEETLLLF